MASLPNESTPETTTQGLGRPLYPMRLLGTASCIIIAWIYVSNFGQMRAWYLFLLVLTLSYPHIFRKMTVRSESRRKFELGASLMDAFVLGSTVYIVGFSPIPALSLLTVALSNGMALGSLPFMGLTAASVMVGMFTPMAFYGVNYNPRGHLLMDMFSAIFLLLYFILFAWVAYKRAILLKESRQELVQQKLALEIEKKKADSLLWALLPASVAKVFETSGVVEKPDAYDEVTLLVADVYEFRDMVERFGPAVALTELNHCFKAFDKIVLRHRLEPLRTIGDAYFAVGGGPTPNTAHATDAVRAASEIQRFARERKATRNASDLPGFDFRVAVHTGPAMCGVMEAHKFCFDVWGDTVGETLEIEQQGRPGDVLLSATTLSRLNESLPVLSAGKVTTRAGSEVGVYTLDIDKET
ncbi:adenylate/guanylate cyclase domain-containing protein [Thermodesulfobacteriota bacterium]